MGTDYECGCRQSGGHWFLCDKHEQTLSNELVEYTDASFIQEICNSIIATGLGESTRLKIEEKRIKITPNAGCFTHNDFIDMIRIYNTFKNDITFSFHNCNNEIYLIIAVI